MFERSVLNSSQNLLPPGPRFIHRLLIGLICRQRFFVIGFSFVVGLFVTGCGGCRGFSCIACSHESVASSFVSDLIESLLQLPHRFGCLRKSCVDASIVSGVKTIDWSFDSRDSLFIRSSISTRGGRPIKHESSFHIRSISSKAKRLTATPTIARHNHLAICSR